MMGELGAWTKKRKAGVEIAEVLDFIGKGVGGSATGWEALAGVIPSDGIPRRSGTFKQYPNHSTLVE